MWHPQWPGMVPTEVGRAGDEQRSQHHVKGAPPNCHGSGTVGTGVGKEELVHNATMQQWWQ